MKKVSISKKQFKLVENTIKNVPLFSKWLSSNINEEKRIIEGLIRTYPIDKVCEYIYDHFSEHNPDIKVYREGNDYGIRIRVQNDKHLIKDMKNVLENLCGYFLALSYVTNDIITLQFEPKFQEVKNDEISKFRYLVHLTPLNKIDKIKEHGIVPKASNESFDYPERVYLFGANSDERTFLRIAASVISFKNNEINNYKYALILIDTEKLSGIRFYKDMNAFNGFWTYDNIPPESFAGIRVFDFKSVMDLF